MDTDSTVLNVPESRHLYTALIAAVVLHALLLMVEVQRRQVEPPLQLIMLDPAVPIDAPAPPPQKQIVSPSDAPSARPPESTNQISERDSSTAVEQIKRGLPDAAEVAARVEPSRPAVPPSQPQKPPAAKRTTTPQAAKPDKPAGSEAQKSAERPAKPAKQPQERKLFLSKSPGTGGPPAPLRSESSQSRLDNLLRSGGYTAKPRASDAARTAQLGDYEPFRPGNSGALFSGTRGSADYLPHVQDGEITMLNAKADRHAVFVRRVALQVFGALRRKSWAELSFPQVAGQSNFATVHAVMSPAGKLLSVSLEDSSGKQAFDGLVVSAANTGTWDQNPPESARAADGNIHFIFKSRTWARFLGDARREQRWLLLATGLL